MAPINRPAEKALRQGRSVTVNVVAKRPISTRPRRSSWKKWVGIAVIALAGLAVLYHAYIFIRVISLRGSNPKTTALIERRADEATSKGQPVRRQQVWVGYNQISRNLVRAVLAGEDSRFFDHSGFDWEMISKALEKDWAEKRFARGASTVSQQLAKNLFLSTSKNPVRKLHEALITWEMENVLGKRRILELYLNVIEWGDGIYGAEAAARNYFNGSAGELSVEQAAFLAAIIPNPRETYNPAKHKRRVTRRRNLIMRLMRHVVVPKDLS